MSKLPAIPYMGSKREIAEDLVKFLRTQNPNAKYFYDVFGGGGAISIQALNQGFTVFYNELNPRVANLMQFLKDLKGKGLPIEWYEFVDRQKFFEIIKSDRTDAYAGMVACCYSFGNKGRDYLFGKDKEDIKRLCYELVVNQSIDAQKELTSKYNLHFDIPQQEKIYNRYLQGYKPQIRQIRGRLALQQLEQLQRLQQLERLEQLQQLERLSITNLSYKDVVITTPIDETIVYCDPPYRGTEKYATGLFNHKEFDDWFGNLPYKAYLSEYTAPFNEVRSVKKRVNLQSDKKESLYKEEKLFCNK